VISLSEGDDSRSYGFDDTGALMTENDWLWHGIDLVPRYDVAVTYSAGDNPHEDFVRSRIFQPQFIKQSGRLPRPGDSGSHFYRSSMVLISIAFDKRLGRHFALPFENGSSDVVLCQQGLQFFSDRAAAALEMRRVLAESGRIEQGFTHVTHQVVEKIPFVPDVESFLLFNLWVAVADLYENARANILTGLSEEAAESLNQFANGSGFWHPMRATWSPVKSLSVRPVFRKASDSAT
jgi:SAM-dependent methyltransferase